SKRDWSSDVCSSDLFTPSFFIFSTTVSSCLENNIIISSFGILNFNKLYTATLTSHSNLGTAGWAITYFIIILSFKLCILPRKGGVESHYSNKLQFYVWSLCLCFWNI